MRVALVAFGFLEYSAWLATALARHCDVTLYLPRVADDPIADRVGPGVDLRLYHQQRMRHPVASLRFTARLIRDIRRRRADVVHVQSGNLYLNPLLPALGDRALVVTCHDPRPHLGDRLSNRRPDIVFDYGYRRADAVIVHGRSLRAEAVRLCRVSPDRVHVVPHHWAPDSVAPDPAEKALVANGRPPVLFFGRIWPYKGLEYLITAQPAITARVPDARFVIAGTGEDLARYRARMHDPSRFEVHDAFIPRDERARLFDEAGVVVLPYVEATQSGVVPLAWAHRRAVVASRVGAIPELVDDGRTGLLVPPRDAGALADALVRVMVDPELAARLGAAGHRKLLTDLSPEVAAAATAEVYRAALARRGR